MSEEQLDEVLTHDDAWEIWDTDSHNLVGVFATYEEACNIIKQAYQEGATLEELIDYYLSGPNDLRATAAHALWGLEPNTGVWFTDFDVREGDEG